MTWFLRQSMGESWHRNFDSNKKGGKKEKERQPCYEKEYNQIKGE